VRAVVLGIDSAPSCTGWALVERDGPRERLIAHGLLHSVDHEIVNEFSSRIVMCGPTVDVVVIEDAYLDENVLTVKVLSRLVGRWQQAFEALGLGTRLVMATVWQSGILKGLIGAGTDRIGRKKAAKIWSNATFGEVLNENEADATGIAVWEIRQRAFAERAAVR
jgi:Holliday junction resolvasome RuvABC endonuclease subunit